MSEFGLTPKGPNIKRLDVILDEMHTMLTEKWGVNTRQNPQSLINHLLTNIADQLAELWELGEDVYFSQYPFSAEGANLDNAAQFGGSTRATAAKSFYPIHCTGIDGTTLAADTTIASKTNPTTYLSITEDKQITRSSFNKAQIKVISSGTGLTYSVTIDSNTYTFVSVTNDPVDILQGIAALIPDAFTATVDDNEEILTIEENSVSASHSLYLSSNLTTETVTSIITFGTVERGDILIPNNVITEIVKADAGLLSVTNLCEYVAGNNEETDEEFRKSYADKIFNRSSMMLESIRSAILNNVQGVTSVAPYENDSNTTDAYGRPPHSIEIVVEGGDATQIAQQILEHKAGGISTYGDEEVTLTGNSDEDIVIRFNRPIKVYVWAKLTITVKQGQLLPANYIDTIRNVVLENIGDLDAGDDVVPQEFMTELYKACTGISYIDIALSSQVETDDEDDSEEEEEVEEETRTYDERYVEISDRQKAYITSDMIEVTLNG